MRTWWWPWCPKEPVSRWPQSGPDSGTLPKARMFLLSAGIWITGAKEPDGWAKYILEGAWNRTFTGYTQFINVPGFQSLSKLKIGDLLFFRL